MAIRRGTWRCWTPWAQEQFEKPANLWPPWQCAEGAFPVLASLAFPPRLATQAAAGAPRF